MGERNTSHTVFFSMQLRAETGLKAVAKGVIRCLAEPADGYTTCGKLPQHYSNCLYLGTERAEATTKLL